MQWNALFQKELTESWRNRKWIWVPLVFMLIAVMDPLTYYFLPEILDLSGGIPENTVIEFPEMTVADAVFASIDSLNMYGIVIIALITMGTISNEKRNGITEIILVKPVKYTNYISAKLAAYALLITVSCLMGFALAWYYINLLFGDLSFSLFLLTACFFSIWCCFIISISIFFNTLFHSSGAVAACTIGSYFLMGIVHTALGHQLPWFPNQLTVYLQEMITTDKIPEDMWGTVLIICVLIVLLVVSAVVLFKRKVVVK